MHRHQDCVVWNVPGLYSVIFISNLYYIGSLQRLMSRVKEGKEIDSGRLVLGTKPILGISAVPNQEPSTIPVGTGNFAVQKMCHGKFAPWCLSCHALP